MTKVHQMALPKSMAPNLGSMQRRDHQIHTGIMMSNRKSDSMLHVYHDMTMVLLGLSSAQRAAQTTDKANLTTIPCCNSLGPHMFLANTGFSRSWLRLVNA